MRWYFAECTEKQKARQEGWGTFAILGFDNSSISSIFPFRPPRRMMRAMNACSSLDTLFSVQNFPDMDAHFRAFASYTRAFYTGGADHDFHLDLKAEHSRNVFLYARKLAEGEAAFAGNPVRRRAVLLAALYHDLGRFRQYHQYGTFSDAQSVNHARLGLSEVKRRRVLDGEPSRVRRLAFAGIILHNRLSLPAHMDADARAVADAVRDADKLDIMRIMAGHLTGEGPVDPVIALHVRRSPEASPAILAAVTARRLGAYADLATTTDFKLLVCGWLYDLNYPLSRVLAATEGHLAALLESLPETAQLAGFTTRYRSELASYGSA